MQLEVSVVEISDLASGVLAEELDGLLSSAGLNRDADIELLALARRGAELVGCLGLAGEVIKCAAVAKSDRGRNLLAPLLTEVRYAALARGRPKLFVYTSPNNREIFTALGFRALAEVPKLVVLMEDDPHGIERYQTTLAKSRRDVEPVGSVVLNANPLTLGHQYLIGRAAEECEVVHVFVVGTDRSEFSYAERLAMVSAGVGEMPQRDRIIVHPGSRYVVSAATFPQYFLKDAADLSRAYAGIDLQLFRNYIAPALGISHRFVGTEPLSAITARYNQEMRYWLEEAASSAPAIQVHEVERIATGAEVIISASRVRSLLAEGRLTELRPLVPATTYDHLIAGRSGTSETTRKEWG